MNLSYHLTKGRGGLPVRSSRSATLDAFHEVSQIQGSWTPSAGSGRFLEADTGLPGGQGTDRGDGLFSQGKSASFQRERILYPLSALTGMGL